MKNFSCHKHCRDSAIDKRGRYSSEGLEFTVVMCIDFCHQILRHNEEVYSKNEIEKTRQYNTSKSKILRFRVSQLQIHKFSGVSYINPIAYGILSFFQLWGGGEGGFPGLLIRNQTFMANSNCFPDPKLYPPTNFSHFKQK